MVRLIVSGGEHAGEPIWSCATYPKCRGTVAVDEYSVGVVAERASSATGSPAPAAFEAQERGPAERIRRAWPVAFGLMLVAMLVAYLLTRAVLGPA